LKAYGEELTPENSLGMETYNIMFKLGFWKKIVYISSIELGLQLTYTFCDLRQFKILTETGQFMTKEDKET